MLFNFKLRPLEEIRPWGGESGNANLHWFGLTDGEYWIQVGDLALLEYSDTAREALGCRRYCDYYVVRLYEDLTEILPHILEPVPERLQPYFSGADRFAAWLDRQDVDSDEIFDLWYDASGWISQRALDTGYLTPSARILLWSDTENVHIEWDNREKLINGEPAWTAVHGSLRMSREDFVRETRAFHDALMTQMSERVDRVLAGALSAGIHIDMDGLKRDHATRSRALERALGPPVLPTDWDRVWTAVNKMAQDTP